MQDLKHKAQQDFNSRFKGDPTLYSQAPGRINIIGEHTDYAGGFSLPAAINCWTLCAWRLRADNRIQIYSSNMNEFWQTSWPELADGIDSSWKKYVAGALLLFKESQLTQEAPKGFDLSLIGNIPLGKGLSSSASIELALLNGLNALYDKTLTPLELTLLAQQVEHRYLNVKSGLLDQFACQFSKKNGALLIDFESLKTIDAPISPQFSSYSWVLVDSLVQRELTNSKYSQRVEEFQTAQNFLTNMGESLRSVNSQQVPELFKSSAKNVRMRARHIVSENERTVLAAEYLKTGDVEKLGRLLLDSHTSLSKYYEVSHPSLDFLVSCGSTMKGVVGGRMMGGGFGGCALFLVHNDNVETFKKSIAKEYESFSTVKTEPRGYQFVDGASAWSET